MLSLRGVVYHDLTMLTVHQKIGIYFKYSTAFTIHSDKAVEQADQGVIVK